MDEYNRRDLELPDWMLLYAYRYTLGRATYAVGEMTDWLLDNWHKLSHNEKELIKHDIKMADKESRIGMDMDRERWLKILEADNELD